MRNIVRGRGSASVVRSLALTLSLGPAILSAAPGTGAGAVAVTSSPEGASVFVDGQYAGTTPLRLEGVAAGAHRVLVAKDGYLENRRVIDVEAGSTRSLEVPLTEQQAQSARLQAGSSGGGGGGRKALLIGLGAAAVGAGAYLLLRDTNDPPTLTGGVTVSPTSGLAAATSISFNAQASDPDGDSLTYSWDFGDGATGSGASTTHTYANAGSYSVTVTVSDGEESVTGTGNVSIRDISGTWTGTLFTTLPITISFSQNGAAVTGSYSDPVNGMGVVTGSVSSPRNISFQVAIPGLAVPTFTGTVESSLNEMGGVANGAGLANTPWRVRR